MLSKPVVVLKNRASPYSDTHNEHYLLVEVGNELLAYTQFIPKDASADYVANAMSVGIGKALATAIYDQITPTH